MIIDYEATNVDEIFRNTQGCAENVRMADDSEYEEFLCVMGEIQENKKRKWEKMKMEKKTKNHNNDNINPCVDCKFAGAIHSYPSYHIVLECVNDDMINTPDLVYGGRTKNYFADCYEIRKQWGVNCPGFVPSSREISIKMRLLIELNNSEKNPRDIVIDDELSATEKMKNQNH